jgi:hypothetical protein
MEEEIPDRLEAFIALELWLHNVQVVDPHRLVPAIVVSIVLGKISKAFVDWVLIYGSGGMLEDIVFTLVVNDLVGCSFHFINEKCDARIRDAIRLYCALGRVLANELGPALLDSGLDDDVMGLGGAFDVIVQGYHPRPR